MAIAWSSHSNRAVISHLLHEETDQNQVHVVDEQLRLRLTLREPWARSYANQTANHIAIT